MIPRSASVCWLAMSVGCVAATAAPEQRAALLREDLTNARALAESAPLDARLLVDEARALLGDIESAATLGTADRAALRAELEATEVEIARARARIELGPDERRLHEAPACAEQQSYLHWFVARIWLCDRPPADENAPPRTVRTARRAAYVAAPSPLCRWYSYVSTARVVCTSSCIDPTDPVDCVSDSPEALETFDPDTAVLIGDPVPIDCDHGDLTECVAPAGGGGDEGDVGRI